VSWPRESLEAAVDLGPDALQVDDETLGSLFTCTGEAKK
jgi:hypothetical protein